MIACQERGKNRFCHAFRMIIDGKEKEMYKIKGSPEREQGHDGYVRGLLIQKTSEDYPVVIIPRLIITAKDKERQDCHYDNKQGKQNEAVVPGLFPAEGESFLRYAMHFRIPASSVSSSGQLSSSCLNAASFARFAIPARMSICFCEAAVRRIK